MRPSVPMTAATPQGDAPTEAEYTQAQAIILKHLDPMGTTAAQTIDQVLRQVGIAVGIRAVGFARAMVHSHRDAYRLTLLEQWVLCCRQLHAQR